MFRMAACRYAAMLIVEPMLREYTVDTIYQTTDLDTIYSLLAKRCERDPDDLIAQWQDDETRQWHDVSAGQMSDRVREVAKGLLGLGVKPGSMVVIYAATCYEWGVVDFACASIGAVSVPVYETDSPKQTGDIVAEVEPVIAFAGDDSHAQILEQIRAHSESLRFVFNFKANGLDAVADFGESVSDEELDKAIGRVRADDLFTIVYTSGSTGKPKGVMLSHRNFNHTVYNGYEVLNDMLYQPSRLLLFLPLAHCFARYIQYVAIGSHGVVGLYLQRQAAARDLRGFKPRICWACPRVREGVQRRSQKAGAGLKGRLFAKRSIISCSGRRTRWPAAIIPWRPHPAQLLHADRGLVDPFRPGPQHEVARLRRRPAQCRSRALLQRIRWHPPSSRGMAIDRDGRALPGEFPGRERGRLRRPARLHLHQARG